MINDTIGMFDSGVGGLTVYKEVKKSLPQEKIIYLGDTKRFPYGSKTKETLIECTKKAIEFLISKGAKAVIIACGTATSQALDAVKDLYDIPIIGIINDTVNYIKEKGYRNVGVIATRGTIKSKAWEKALKEKIKGINLQSKECPLLAPMAEEGWTNNEIAKLTVSEYLKDFKDIEALVLGCTHYPLFLEIIKDNFPDTDIINTGMPIAMNLKEKRLIEKDNILHKEKMEDDEFYLTETSCNFIKVAYNILGKEIEIKKTDI